MTTSERARALKGAVLDLLSHLEIEDCDRDGGRDAIGDACAICGGFGEVVRGTILPEEYRALREASR